MRILRWYMCAGEEEVRRCSKRERPEQEIFGNVWIVVNGAGDYEDLKRFEDKFREQISKIEGVKWLEEYGTSSVNGMWEREIWIWTPEWPKSPPVITQTRIKRAIRHAAVSAGYIPERWLKL